jgi:hypothetical protein
VAVAAGFAAIYPRATPGGWHLLGRTTETLFDPEVPPHSRVAPGDRVRFVVADRGGGDGDEPARPSRGRPLLRADGPCLEVLEPGLATTVQDGGRRGTARLGVPVGGTADRRSAALVNLLLGNGRDAAVLECTAVGPALRMAGDGHLAVVGTGRVEVSVDGHPAPDGAVLPVADGQVVRIGRVDGGLRAYLGVAGGFATPCLLGSRSTDVLTGGRGPGVPRGCGSWPAPTATSTAWWAPTGRWGPTWTGSGSGWCPGTGSGRTADRRARPPRW